VHYQLARAYQALQRSDEARAALEEYQKRRSGDAARTDDERGAQVTGSGDAVLTPP
jgi:hypothetical protein